MADQGAGRRPSGGRFPVGTIETERDPRGQTSLERPRARVLVFRMSGYFTEQQARFALERNEAILADVDGPVTCFYDAWEMTGYDSTARALCTSWVRAHRAQLAGAHFLVRSSIVAMGVNVANLALGGWLHATTEREPFEAELNAALARGAR